MQDNYPDKNLVSSEEQEEFNELTSSLITLSQQATSLTELKKIFDESEEFEVDDIVIWKDGLKNKTYPSYEQVAIVLEVLSEPLYNQSVEPDSPYYNEPLDILLGFKDQEGDMLTFYYDKRRFKKLKED